MIDLHNNSIFVVSLFALCLISGFITDQTAYAYDGDTSKFSVLKEELAREKNLANANRVSGMLSDVLRTQKLLFVEKNGNKLNTVARKSENLLSESNLYASMGDYDGCYKAMQTVYDLLKESYLELGKK